MAVAVTEAATSAAAAAAAATAAAAAVATVAAATAASGEEMVLVLSNVFTAKKGGQKSKRGSFLFAFLSLSLFSMQGTGKERRRADSRGRRSSV